MTVRPYSSLRVLELAAKGTILNKELLNRQHYEPVGDADRPSSWNWSTAGRWNSPNYIPPAAEWPVRFRDHPLAAVVRSRTRLAE